MSNKVPTIHELRKRGFKVRVNHFRYILPEREVNNDRFTNPLVIPTLVRVTKADKKSRKFGENGSRILAKGGVTELQLTPPGDGSVTDTKESRCNAKDPFNRRLGVRICLNRFVHAGLI